MNRLRRYAPKVLAVAFTVSGVAHFLRPETFTSLVPRQLPTSPETIVYASGAVELILAAGLFAGKRRAGIASAVFLAILFWSHIQMLLDFQTKYGAAATPTLIAWVRLPLQLALIWAALQSGRREED